MLTLYALCAVPFLMLGVICLAVVGKVREGRYRKAWLGNPAEAPRPGAAVATVLAPFVLVLILAASTGQLGWLGATLLLVMAAIIGFFAYRAAADRHAQHSK